MQAHLKENRKRHSMQQIHTPMHETDIRMQAHLKEDRKRQKAEGGKEARLRPTYEIRERPACK